MAANKAKFQQVFEGHLLTQGFVDFKYSKKEFHLKLHRAVVEKKFADRKTKEKRAVTKNQGRAELTAADQNGIKNQALATFKYDPQAYDASTNSHWLLLEGSVAECVGESVKPKGKIRSFQTMKCVEVLEEDLPSQTCQCGNVCSIKKVTQLGSPLNGYFFYKCERVITLHPFKLCGFYSYIT